MKRWRLALLLVLGLLQPAQAEPPKPASAREVLVMLHMPAPHFRADAAYGGAYRSDAGRGARRRIALELAEAHGLTLVSDWPMPVLGVDCYVLALPPKADPAQVAALLSKDARVEWAQPVEAFRTLGAAPDPLYAVQPAASQWRLSELHKSATGRRVTVAVIDSGVDEQHPDLAGQITLRQNFIDGQSYVVENHGTAVAGIIAALEDNGLGIRGVAPGARVLALRACSEAGGGAAQCSSFSLGKALNFAILREPQIINLSLGGPPDRLLQRLIEAAQARGIKIVGALDAQARDGGFPAALPGVFAAGDGASAPALAAPGRDVPVPLVGARYGVVSGSSYSAAHLSGLLALLVELKPQENATQLRARLASGDGMLRVAAGGPIDTCAVLARASQACVCGCSGAPPTKTATLP